jgi:hypothetical protein
MAGAALFVGAPLGTFLGLLGPKAFFLFLLGAALGLVALGLGCIAVWRTRPAAHRPVRQRALVGLGLGLVIVVSLGLIRTSGGGASVPMINDITTDVEDPPVFVFAPTLTGTDMAYDASRYAAPTRLAYADLQTIFLPIPPQQAFGRVEGAADQLGWEVTHRDRNGGILEATDTTRVFRFVDDVVVRIRSAPGGSEIDVRSKSRLGRGDMGTNAARIRALRDAITH